MSKSLIAGSAEVNITPSSPCFLWGYPNEERKSTGVNDPLMSASLYLSDGRTELLFISNDLIFVSKELCQRIRGRISSETGIPPEAILISATHTHSGPTIINYLSNTEDPHVPLADGKYLDFLVEEISQCACRSVRQAVEAEIGQIYTYIECVGTNRDEPTGPNDNKASLLLARKRKGRAPIGAMVVYGMHPTVLHEDSTLISADFPGMVRAYLQENLVGSQCPVVYHNGVCGNLSPRYTARSNTVEEVIRLGFLCGKQLVDAARQLNFSSCIELSFFNRYVVPEVRQLPNVEEALALLQEAQDKLKKLVSNAAMRPIVRTAECAVFGAEETLTLSRLANSPQYISAIASTLPAEISLFKVGDGLFLSWPGEFFVEYSIPLKRRYPNLSIISMANGELQGYIVTEAAAEAGCYEASNALFSFRNGSRFVRTSEAMIEEARTASGKVAYEI